MTFHSSVASVLVGLGALVTFLGLGSFTAQSKVTEPNSDTQVLFIGNSFTSFHGLPKMVAELAQAGEQRAIHYQTETPGGFTLERHWNDRKALSLIQSRRWDFVVLQEQSQAPLMQPAAMFDYGRKFDGEIRRRGAKTILYETWALQNKPEQQPAISKAYDRLSKDLHARLAPVGTAWQAALATDQNLILHEADQKHPNATGTYLAACVFYGTIYGKSPEGLPGRIGGLSDDNARRLQAIAWKAVQKADKRDR